MEIINNSLGKRNAHPVALARMRPFFFTINELPINAELDSACEPHRRVGQWPRLNLHSALRSQCCACVESECTRTEFPAKTNKKNGRGDTRALLRRKETVHTCEVLGARFKYAVRSTAQPSSHYIVYLAYRKQSSHTLFCEVEKHKKIFDGQKTLDTCWYVQQTTTPHSTVE